MDENGYPTKDELRRVEGWDVHDVNGFHDFMIYVETLWYYPEYWHRKGDVYRISTGGWSGNEDVILAMKKNRMFWMLFWGSSRRGGHYVFAPHNADID